jgi:transposase
MMEQKPAEIPDEEWQQISPATRVFIVQLVKRNQELETRLRDVEEQLGQNSHNSSRPPSSDRPDQAKKKQTSQAQKSQRNRGGQPGHQRQARPLKPVEQVNKVVPVKPEQCRHCGAALTGEDPQPYRHQVTDIPPLEPVVIEYQLASLSCDQCGQTTRAELPLGVPERAFGPRLQSIGSLLSGVYRLSRRQVEALMADIFKVEVALGSLKNLEQDTSQAVAQPVAAAQAYVRWQAQANLDETGWFQENKPAWLWVAVTTWVTIFVIRFSRGGQVVKEILGETFPGIVNCDRWSAYNWLPPSCRQLCWAHLRRDFLAFVERAGTSASLGQALLTEAELMFAWWYKLRQGDINRTLFQEIMRPIRAEITRLLDQGTTCQHPKTAATCAHILKRQAALWTFVDLEGIEPTNNAAERAIRTGVIWRKTSLGTQSEAGSLFVERMLTVAATLKQQNRNILDYLIAACTARLSNQPAPSLLPPSQ